MGQFRISTNIARDSEAQIDYIVTKNANEVYNRIIHNYSKGQGSFTIIGSYGTGKSTFLWAFENHLKGNVKFNHPVNGEFKGIKNFEFKRIVGEGTSFKLRFCEEFGIALDDRLTHKQILKSFEIICERLKLKKRVLVILVDEFGKHLEHIAKAAPEEMYFIQELAEFCNNPDRQILFITTLHQNFSAYAKRLSQTEQNEWNKVKGRLIDIAFDEPVDQLLYFAAQRLKNVEVPNTIRKQYDNYTKVLLESKLLGRSSVSSNENLEELYPLDPLAAFILTQALQRYGQNERSLFSFLESVELTTKIKNHDLFTVSDCFDYLITNLSSEIEDGEKNPFKPQWKAAILALEKAEFLFEDNFNDAAKILKAVCLVNIFCNAGGIFDDRVLVSYGQNILHTKSAQHVLSILIEKNIIKFSRHRSKYNFIDGTDIDLEQELIAAAQHIDRDIEIVARLESYFDLGVIVAKRIQYEKGTPRLFKFRFMSEITPTEPIGEIDGFINLIFTRKRILKQIEDAAESLSPAQIFVLFKEIDRIEETLFEIDKINYVSKKYFDDKVALHLLNEERLFRTNQLQDFVELALFSADSNVKWIWNSKIDKLNGGKKRKISSAKELNKLLSDASEVAYHATPVYRNEMVNKEILSSPIRTARKALIRQMINHGSDEDLAFETKRFPPEKTIYLSLLKRTGIHRNENGHVLYGNPTDDSFQELWKRSLEILDKSQSARTSIQAFYKALSEEPYKLKGGFLDFWVPIFLIIKKEDYSLYYHDGEYIPHLTPDVMDLIHKHPSKYYLKALSADGVRSNYLTFYKELIGYNESNIKGLESSYITIYGNFLRFYRGLEEYTKKTKQALPKEAIEVRNAIADAKDPESALFQAIPEALGYYEMATSPKKIEGFLDSLQMSIRHIRSAYDNLIDSLQKEISLHLNLTASDFDEFKGKVSILFSPINRNLILNNQLKVFFSRVVSPLDIKKAYWESLCDATLGKKLDKITDDEVEILKDRMKYNFDSLVQLLDVHSVKITDDQDIVQISLIDQSGTRNFRKNIVFRRDDIQSINEIKNKLSQMLGENLELNKAALIALLEEELIRNE